MTLQDSIEQQSRTRAQSLAGTNKPRDSTVTCTDRMPGPIMPDGTITGKNGYLNLSIRADEPSSCRSQEKVGASYFILEYSTSFSQVLLLFLFRKDLNERKVFWQELQSDKQTFFKISTASVGQEVTRSRARSLPSFYVPVRQPWSSVPHVTVPLDCRRLK